MFLCKLDMPAAEEHTEQLQLLHVPIVSVMFASLVEGFLLSLLL